MKKYLLIIAIILSTMPIPVLASDWHYIGNGYYIDLESISKYPNSFLYPNNNMYTFWTKVVDEDSQAAKYVLKEMSKMDKVNIIEVKGQQIIDCPRKKIAVVSIITYKSDGIPAYNSSFNEYQYQWESIVPDSFQEFYYKLICQPKGY